MWAYCNASKALYERPGAEPRPQRADRGQLPRPQPARGLWTAGLAAGAAVAHRRARSPTLVEKPVRRLRPRSATVLASGCFLA